MRPITPQPGYVEADVTSAMESGQFVYVDCFTFLPKVGDPLRYTNYQQDVSVVPVGYVDRQIYRARQINISGLRVRNNLGVEVDEQQLSLAYPADLYYQASLGWSQALIQGRLDGASVRRDRYISAQPGGPWLGGFPMFLGLVSSLDQVGRQTATVNVKSHLILLNVQSPRDLFETNCKNVWGDTACGIIQSDWAVEGLVGPSPTRTNIPWSSSSTEYAMGKIHISNGDDVTRVRTVAKATSTYLQLAYPLDFDPVESMHFTAYPGDDRTMARCEHFQGVDWRNKFKGFPYVPVAETAIGGGGTVEA